MAQAALAVRGGILDIYSWQAQLPFSVEFFGDDIELLPRIRYRYANIAA